jgi:hypothetical protein
MQGGYQVMTVGQLANGLWAAGEKGTGWAGFRVYLACAELVAIRAAARRSRSPRRTKGERHCHFRVEELVRLTGLRPAAVRRAQRRLAAIGLATFTAEAITLRKEPLEQAVELARQLAGARSVARPVPVPRVLLRHWAKQRHAGRVKVMLGYVVRGLTLAPQTGEIRAKGTVKASWLAATLGLSLRTVRYAQAWLQRTGWVPKDTGSFQRKLNRDGAYFVLNLDWRPAATGRVVKRDKARGQIAPPVPKKCTRFAPPRKDRETSTEGKHQEARLCRRTLVAGVCNRGGEGEASPSLSDVKPEDLRRLSRVEALYRQACQRGWLVPGEANRLNVFAAAVRAREVGRDPPRVFVTLLRRRLWHHVTQAQEDRARKALGRALRTGGFADGQRPWYDWRSTPEVHFSPTAWPHR